MGVADNLESRGIRWPLTRWDVAGAFGDIGVLFPIAIALISLNHVDPTAVFLAAGVTYVLAGRYFQIPMAVQPFKAGSRLPAHGIAPRYWNPPFPGILELIFLRRVYRIEYHG